MNFCWLFWITLMHSLRGWLLKTNLNQWQCKLNNLARILMGTSQNVKISTAQHNNYKTLYPVICRIEHCVKLFASGFYSSSFSSRDFFRYYVEDIVCSRHVALLLDSRALQQQNCSVPPFSNSFFPRGTLIWEEELMGVSNDAKCGTQNWCMTNLLFWKGNQVWLRKRP